MATIYAYSSNSIYCTYSLSIARSGSTITITASGTIYGNGSSYDGSGKHLWAHLRYNVSPANTGTASTYVSSYGNSFGAGVKVVNSPLNSSSIPKSGKSFTAKWTITSNDAKTYENCALFFSKESDSITKGSTESYAFIGKKDSDLSVNNLRYYTQKLSIGAGYTDCTAPTSVTTSVSVQKPGGTVKISWSGAKSGSNNTIATYVVYWRLGGNPTTSTYTSYHVVDVTNGTTSGSYTYTIPEKIDDTSTRGKTFYFKVLTRGTAGSSYYSSISSDNASTTVNTLPNAPTVSASTSTVVSSGGDVKFTVTAGAVNNSGQTATLYYATSSSGTKTKFTSPLTKTVTSSANKTLYFYTYDGLEYSSAKSVTTTVNTKPTCTAAMSITGTQYTQGSTNYKVPTVNLTGSSSKSGVTYQWYLVYSSGTSFDKTKETAVSISTSLSPSNVNLKGKIPFGSAYKCKFRVKDSYEYSDWVYTSTTGIIPSKPTLTSTIYNALNKGTVTGAVAGHFNNNLSVGFTQDTGVTVSSVTINSQSPSTSITNNDTLNISGLRGITTEGGSYTIKIVLAHKATTDTIEKSYTVVRSSAPTNSVTVQSTIKPLPQTGTYSITIGSFDISKVDYTTSSTFSCNIKVNNNSIMNTPLPTDTLVNNTNKTYYFNINGINITNLSTNTTIAATADITFTDVFEATHTISKNLTLDTREPFTTLSNFVVQVKPKNSDTWSSIGNNDIILREGDKIRYNLTATAYHGGSATFKLNICQSDSTSGSNYTTFITDTETISLSGGSYSFTSSEYTIKEVKNSKYILFQASAQFNNGTSIKTIQNSYYARSQRLTTLSPLAFDILKCGNGQNNNKKITWSHKKITNSGGGLIGATQTWTYVGITKMIIDVEYQTDSNWAVLESYTFTNDATPLISTEVGNTATREIEIPIETNNNAIIFDDVFKNGAAIFRLKITTYSDVSSQDSNYPKITYGTVTTVYDTAPTVSYRSNTVGINHEVTKAEQLSEKGLIISASGTTTGTTKKIVAFVVNNNECTINIQTGEINGFIIDGGSWS